MRLHRGALTPGGCCMTVGLGLDCYWLPFIFKLLSRSIESSDRPSNAAIRSPSMQPSKGPGDSGHYERHLQAYHHLPALGVELVDVNEPFDLVQMNEVEGKASLESVCSKALPAVLFKCFAQSSIVV